MNNFTIGQLIKALREQQGVSQEQLTAGVMQRHNLSKIESGQQTVSFGKLALLFERLGYSLRRFFPAMLSAEENAFYDLRDKINACIRANDKEGTIQGIHELEGTALFADKRYEKDGMIRQFWLSSKAALGLMEEENLNNIRAWLDEAIRITIPAFNEDKVPRYLLTLEEIEIITMMASVYEKGKNRAQATTLLEKLANNIRKNYMDRHQKARALTLVLYILSNCLGRQGHYQEALAVCNEAIDVGQVGEACGLVPKLLYNKAYALCCLGQMDDVKPLLRQSFYGHMMMGRADRAAGVKVRAKRNWGISIED